MSAVDDGLTLPEKQALELQHIVRVYMTSPDHSAANDVLTAVEESIDRLTSDPKLARMFQEMSE